LKARYRRRVVCAVKDFGAIWFPSSIACSAVVKAAVCFAAFNVPKQSGEACHTIGTSLMLGVLDCGSLPVLIGLPLWCY